MAKQPNIIVNVTNANTQSAPERQFNNGKEIVERNWALMLVLSILFGWLGADRFYAGHIGLGILKLILCMMWVGIIWWIIDIIMVATKNIRYVKFV